MGHARIEFIEIFKEPDAGNAVHLRQVKSNLCRLAVIEFQQFILHIRVVEVSISAGIALVFERLTRLFIQGVVVAQVVGVEYFIHHFATVAAKIFISQLQPLIGALVVTVETGMFLYSRIFRVREDSSRHRQADFVRLKSIGSVSIATATAVMCRGDIGQ